MLFPYVLLSPVTPFIRAPIRVVAWRRPLTDFGCSPSLDFPPAVPLGVISAFVVRCTLAWMVDARWNCARRRPITDATLEV